MSNRYALYTAAFDAGANSLSLPQVRGMGLRTGKSMTAIHPSGSIDPAAYVMSTARPSIPLASRDLATIFGDSNVPVSISAGLDVSDGATFMFRRRTAGGAFTTGSVHSVLTVASGFLHCVELAADAESQDGAEAALEFIPLSADGLSPFTFIDDQAIPGALPAPAYNSVYYHGPAYYNSSLLPGLVSTRVRPGINYSARIVDGGSYPRRAASSIVSRTPIIELTFLKVDMADSILGNIMVNAFASTLAVYFWKGAANGEGRVAAASSVHLKISAAAGSWGPDDVSVSDENDATLTLTITPTGTLSLSAASAIGA